MLSRAIRALPRAAAAAAASARPVGAASLRALSARPAAALRAAQPATTQAAATTTTTTQAAAPAADKFGAADPDVFTQEARAALKRGDTQHAFGLHPDAGAIGLPGVIDKVGLWPLAGLGLAALASKEVYILNEETLIVCTFSSFLGTAYLALRDTVRSGLQSTVDEIANEQYRAYDSLIDKLDDCIKAEKRYASVVEETKGMQTEFLAVVDRVLAARDAKFQNAVAQAVEDRLSEIEKEETRALGDYATRVTAGAVSFARAKLSNASAQTKADIVNAVIAGLSGKASTNDPVRKVFMTYFEGHRKAYEKIKKEGFAAPTPQQQEVLKKKWAEVQQKIVDDREALLKLVPAEMREEYAKEYDRMRAELTGTLFKGKPSQPSFNKRVKLPY